MPALPNISSSLIQKYQEEVSKNSSEATAKRKSASLNKFFGWAQREGHIDANPMPSPPPSPNGNHTTINPKSNKNIGLKTWAILGTTLGIIILIFLLTWKLKFPIQFINNMAANIGGGTVTQVVPTPTPASGISANPTGNTRWNLYANLKLMDSTGSPQVGSQTITFKVYNTQNGGSPLYSEGPQTVTTDSNGSALISLDQVPSDLFFQNRELFLEPEIGSVAASTRIPISTANIAANLGGYFPANPDTGAAELTIPVVDGNGSLNLASTSPAINAKAGTLLVQGQAVTVKSVDGGNGNIEINPDGSGIAHFLFEGSTGNFLNAQAPNLNSGSLYYGVVANNAAGYYLLKLQSGSTTPITRFSVDALGNASASGNINAGGDLQTAGVSRVSTAGALENITGYSQNSGNFTINQKPGDFASILKTGSALSNAVNITLDERTAPNASDYAALVLRRYNGNNDMALLVDVGNAQFNGQIRLGRFDTNPGAMGTGSLIYNATDNKVYVWDGSAWTAVGTSSISFDHITSGTNTTAAMVVGNGASLNYTGTGTINASSLEGKTWEAPGTIGSTTPNSGAFTSLVLTGGLANDITTTAGNSLTINSNGTGTINVGTDTDNESLNFGTGGGVKDVTIGSLTGASTTTIWSGTSGILIGDRAVNKQINIGGNIFNATDTVNISTNGASPDTISIGNANAGTTLSLTSGVWSIATTGVATGLSISGSTNTLSNIPNSALTNSSVSLAGNSGSGTVALGGTLTLNGSGGTTTSVSGSTVTINSPTITPLNVRETDLTPSVSPTTTIEFGPTVTSSDEFIVSDETGGVARIRVGNKVVLTDASQILTNKTIDAASNTISNLTNANLSGSAGITNANLANSSITFAGNAGSGVISLGGTETITGSNGITTSQSGSTLTVAGVNATTITPGVASFDPNFFTVTSGNVSILNDSFDFAQFKDNMTLDATTDIATGGFTLSTSGIGALNFASTGQVTFAGNVDATNGLDVTTANLTVGGANFSVDQATGNITTAGDIAVNGGDITTTTVTATVFNTTATILSIGGGATTALNIGNGNTAYTAINIGSGTGGNTINIAGTGATGADTVNIGTGGTGADTITVGNAASTTTINLTKGTTGNIVLTSFNCTGYTNGGKLTTDASGNVTCTNDVGGTGSSVRWSDITGPISNLSLAMGTYTTTMDWTATGALSPWTMNLINNDATAATQNFVTINNAVTTQAGNTEALLVLNNADTSVAGSTIVDNALLITNSGGIASGITDAIDVSATGITNAINVGANTILGTTADINLNNFDVTGATGDITTAGDIAVNGGDITSSAATLNINAGGNVDVQDALNADSITSDAGVSIAAGNSYTGAGAVTLSSAATATLTVDSGTTGDVNLGTGNNAKIINIGTGTAGNTINIATDNTTKDTVNIGSIKDDVIINGAGAGSLINFANFDVATTGNITVATGVGLDTNAGAGTLALGNVNATTLNVGDSNTATAINIGSGTGGNTINIAGTGATGVDTVNIGTGATGADLITIGSANAGASSFISGAALTLTAGATSTWGTTGGNLNLQVGGTGTTANVQIGAGGAGSTTPDFLGLDVKSDTGDPVVGGFEGAMYYNTFDNKFRCYQGVTWTDCIGTSGGPTTSTLQDVYNNDADGGDAIIALTATDGSLIFRNPAAAGTASSFVLKLDQLANAAVDGLQIAQAGTGAGLNMSFTNAGTTADGIIITSTNALTDAIDLSDADIVNAINVGPNVILGTAAVIDFTNFDVASTGHITVQPGYGLDTNAAGELKLGDTTATTVSVGTTAATTLNFGAGGTLTRTINIGTGTGIDTIHLGDGATGADLITIGSANAGASSFKSGAALTLTAGAASTWSTSVGTLTITSADAATWSTAASALTLQGATALNLTAVNGNSTWKTTAGTLTIQSGDNTTSALSVNTVNKTSANSGKISLSTGTTTTSGNSGDIAITTGNSAGNSGAVSIDAGTAATTVGTVSLGDTNATTVNIGSTAATTLNFGAGGALARTINIGTGTGVDIIHLGDGATGADLITIGSANAGASSFKSGAALTLTGGAASTWSTSTGALTLTSAAAATWGTAVGNLNLQVAGTGTTANVQVGAGGGGSPTPDLLVLDIKSDAEGVFAGTNGAMYYNASTNKFRCYQSGAWADCVGGGSTSNWTLNATDGTLYPINSTVDVLMGATSTASAKFAFTNMNTGTPVFQTTGVIHTGGVTTPTTLAYNQLGTTATTHTLTTSSDLLISGKEEINGVLYLNGRNISSSGGTSTIVFPSAPTAIDSYNLLTNGSWLIQNPASGGNPGIAALMVDQNKGGDILSASSSGTTKFTIANNGNVTISGSGTMLTVGGGTGKIDVGTVDPVYNINGTKYATYLAGMTGVKEETTGTLQTSEYIAGIGYRQVLDFKDLGVGSDLWLFGQATDVKNHIGQMVVLLSPTDNTRTWYQVDKNNYTLSVYSDRPTQVSYRLSAPRFDAATWNNLNDNLDATGFEIHSSDLTGGSTQTPNGLSFADFEIVKNIESNAYKLYQNIADGGKIAIEEFGSFANLVAANIKAGTVNVENLIAQNTQTTLISPIPGGTDVTVQIGSQATPSGKFAIQNSTGTEVASIDNTGNASFSGTVNSQQLTVNSEATISGTLYADNIKSKSLDEIQALLTQVSTDQSVLLSATAGANLNATGSATISELITNDLYVTGQAAINSLSVTKTIAIGSDMIFGPDNTLNSLSTPLQIQSLAMAPIQIMAGLVTIDTHGNVQIAGDLVVAGKIRSSGLTIQDASGTQVAQVDATGSASFRDLAISGLAIASDSSASDSAVINGVITTNATAGKATIPTGVTEITIKNPKISDYTLVYITPTSSTLNNVLYVKSKETGQFVVGFTDPISIDASFNWWVIQTN